MSSHNFRCALLTVELDGSRGGGALVEFVVAQPDNIAQQNAARRRRLFKSPILRPERKDQGRTRYQKANGFT
jgi:hypothetical protein